MGMYHIFPKMRRFSKIDYEMDKQYERRFPQIDDHDILPP
jgi:hypothetical protein